MDPAGGTMVAMTLRRPPTGAVKRVVTAVVAVPLFVSMVMRAPDAFFVVFVVAVSGVATWELARMFEHAGAPADGWLGVVLAAAVTAGFATPAPAAVLTLATAVALCAPLWRRGRPSTAEPTALALMGVLYVGWFLGHAILLRRLADGAALVLFLVGVTWIGETAAYAVGSLTGRRKLAPVISPNKTVEGALAQFAGSIVAGLALGVWLLPRWPIAVAAGAGALLGVVGQLGDLAESAMKRSVGVKDTGGLVPGHGGLLDRIDGLLFNTPILYYYVVAGGPA